MPEKYIDLCGGKLILVKDKDTVVDIRKLVMGKKTQVVISFDSEAKK